jgi:type I restriction enzyme, S subunit
MAYEGTKRLGDFFSSRREKGCVGLPFLSVTVNDGLVDRDSLDRKFDTNIPPEKHLLVKKGDIAYNMMRMWQGASGMANKDGLVSPAYVVLKPRQGVDSSFAAHLFKSPRLIHMFWAYSYGLTDDRLRLYFADFARIPVTLPPIGSQKAMGKMLAVWSDAADLVDQMIENSRREKRGLMQRLLSGKSRGEKTGTWKQCRLGELFSERTEIGRVDLPLLSVTREGGVVSQEELERKDSSSEDKSKYLRVCPGDIAYNTMRMWQGISGLSSREGIVSPAYTVVTPRAGASGRFMAHLFKSSQMIHSFYRYSQGLVSDTWNLKYRHFAEIPILLPSASKQELIADVLDNASERIRRLERLGLLFVEERRALMQQLLSGKRHVKIDSSAAA